MRAEDDAAAVRHVQTGVHKDGAAGGELLYHVQVVDDFLANVDRRSENLQGNLHDVDRADHAGTEAARAQQENFLHASARPSWNSQ